MTGHNGCAMQAFAQNHQATSEATWEGYTTQVRAWLHEQQAAADVHPALKQGDFDTFWTEPDEQAGAHQSQAKTCLCLLLDNALASSAEGAESEAICIASATPAFNHCSFQLVSPDCTRPYYAGTVVWQVQLAGYFMPDRAVCRLASLTSALVVVRHKQPLRGLSLQHAC